MTQQSVKAQLKLMKSGAFIGIIGGIASFWGEPHHGLIKTMIGVVIGCALLGKRLILALNEALETNQEMVDEIEKKFFD